MPALTTNFCIAFDGVYPSRRDSNPIAGAEASTGDHLMEPFVGQIQPFVFNYARRYWTFCNGAILPISQNTALFSLLGNAYGGDGKTTFMLPNLAGRAGSTQGGGPG